MLIKHVMKNPAIYQAVQVAGGFHPARVRAIRAHLALSPGQRVIDIGCGPGHIVAELPQGVVYEGFDVDRTYIEFANRRFGKLGQFHCRLFDESTASDFGPADVVIMNGVLHHMDDDTVRMTASVISKALKPSGVFFAMDPVYIPGQNPLTKWLLDHDRGRFIRTEQGYRQLLSPVFASCEFHVHQDLTWVPYSFIISKCQRT